MLSLVACVLRCESTVAVAVCTNQKISNDFSTPPAPRATPTPEAETPQSDHGLESAPAAGPYRAGARPPAGPHGPSAKSTLPMKPSVASEAWRVPRAAELRRVACSGLSVFGSWLVPETGRGPWRQHETCRGLIKDATNRSPFHGKCENPALAHPVSLLIDMLIPSNLC